MKKLFLAFFLVLSIHAISQVPVGYYDGTEGLTGEELKHKLHTIIRNHKVWTYGDFRDTILPTLDEDPNNPDNLIVLYKNYSVPKSDFASTDDSWNREHTWPSSHGFSEPDTAYTDVHNLRPSDVSVNSSKSNKDFNYVPHTTQNKEGEAPDTYTDSDFWEPRDEIKGDVARILFYMDTRYDSPAMDLKLVDHGTGTVAELGVLSTLLEWHKNDPVDDMERKRHEGEYGFQGNRNPFVDHPEWVSAIWGSSTNPLLLFDKQNFNGNFGKVKLGKSIVQKYTINTYRLTSGVSVKSNPASSSFSLSTDQQNWVDSVGFVDNGEGAQSYDVYVKYSPVVEGEKAAAEIQHITEGNTKLLKITGEEGELPIVPIASARMLALGDMVRISGVVIDAGNNSGNSRVIYDGTAGIVVRSFNIGNESSKLEQGDSVEIFGGISDYSGLLQISGAPITINLIKKNAHLPKPKVVAINEVGESLESQLVTVENVSFVEKGEFKGGGSDGNYTITDGNKSMAFRIGSSSHPLVGTTIPAGKYNITGIMGQFNSDYQLLPRDKNDLVEVDGSENLDLITIQEARQKKLGERVKVAGVVISNGSNSTDNRAIYDGTAGIVVRSVGTVHASKDLELGDSVVIAGGLYDYNGLLQIEEGPISIQLVKKGSMLPQGQEISLDQVGEGYESEPVLLHGARFVQKGEFKVGDYTITNGENELVFRIGKEGHPLIGNSIPSGIVDISGFITQEKEGYFVLVNDKSDVVETKILGITGHQGQKVYPNPFCDYVIMTGDMGEMFLYNSLGKEIHGYTIAGNRLMMNKLSKGVYILITQKGGIYRLIKQ